MTVLAGGNLAADRRHPLARPVVVRLARFRDQSVIVGGNLSARRWSPPQRTLGNQSKKLFTGTTTDADGVAIGGVTVQAWRVSPQVLAGQVVSDALGYYLLPTTATDSQFLAAFKSGTPDLVGKTGPLTPT